MLKSKESELSISIGILIFCIYILIVDIGVLYIIYFDFIEIVGKNLKL